MNDQGYMMKREECEQELWKAGDRVLAGVYARVDDQSYHLVVLEQEGVLPASFDGHTAWYCTSSCHRMTHAWLVKGTKHTAGEASFSTGEGRGMEDVEAGS